MPAQKGRALRIKRGQGDIDPGPETFTAIAGAREDSLTGNQGQIDISDKDSAGYRELLEGGIKSMSLSCSGIEKNQDLFEAWLSGAIENYQIDDEEGNLIAAAFQIASYEKGGTHEEGQTFSATFESSGAITFTPAA